MRETLSGCQTVAPQVSCGYCGKSNQVKNDCWRKSGKCLYYGSADHQLVSCLRVPKVGGSTQRPEKSASKQSSAEGSRSKAPARVYALNHQQVSNSTKVVQGTIIVFHCLAKVLK